MAEDAHNPEDNNPARLDKLIEAQKIMQERMKQLEAQLQEARKGQKDPKNDQQELKEDIHEADDAGNELMEMRLEGLGETIETYVSGILDSVSDSLEGAMQGMFARAERDTARSQRRSEKARRRAERVQRKLSKKRFRLTEEDLASIPEEGAKILSVLADTNRLKILQELERGPDYQKDISERTGIKGGQWKHHTDSLKAALLIDQEAVQGRYIITQLGLEAYKLAEMLYIRKKTYENEIATDRNADFDEPDGVDVSID